MTDTNEKIRALFLTALMVVSVFGATVAFSGAAAAANNGSLTVGDDGEEASTKYTHSADLANGADLQYIDVDFSTDSSTDPDLSSVGEADIEVYSPQGDRTDEGDITGVTTSNGELSFQLENSIDGLGSGDNVTVVVDDVTNPTVNSDTTLTFNVSYQTTTEGDQFDSDEQDYTINNVGEGGGPPGLSSAVSYTSQGTTVIPSGETGVELRFNESVESDTVDAGNFVAVLRDGTTVSPSSAEDANADDDRAVILDFDTQADATEITEINVTTGSSFDDLSGNSISGSDVANQTVTSTSSTAAETQGNITAYEGGNIALVGNNTDEQFEVQDSDESAVVSRQAPTDAQVFAYDSSNLDAGNNYLVLFNGRTTFTGDDVGVDLRSLGLNQSVDETNVTTDDEITGTVSADAVDRDVEVTLTQPDDTEVTTTVSIDGDGEVDFSFDSQSDNGEYTVQTEDLGTGVTTDETTVNISEAAEGTASFDQSIIETPRGDVVEINVSLTSVETARIQIGDADELNYYADLTVTDGNEDGEVALQFNTNDNSYSVADTPTGEDSDSVTVDNNGPASPVLDAADYSANVSVNGDEEGVSTVVLTERGTDDMVLWTSAGGDYGKISSGSDVAPFVEAGNLTQTGQVAKGDTVVHQIEVTGVYGAVQAELDADADNATVALTNVLGNDGVDLTMVQTNPSANQDRKVLDIEATPASAINVVADSDNGTLYVNVDTSKAVFDQTDSDDWEPSDTSGEYSGSGSYSSTSDDVDLEDGDRFNVTFFVGEDSALIDDDDEAVSAQFEVTDRTASFDSSQETADNEPLVTVQNASNQTVSGTTSVAPGTNVTVRARATGDSPFLKTQEVEVHDHGDGGVFHANLDFSDVSTGTNFTLTVPNQGFEDNVETDGRVAPKPTASVSISNQTTDGTTVTVDSASLSNGGFVTIHDGSLADGAVFDSVRGTSAYLEAGSHSDIEVSLDAPYESDGAAIAMPHQDTNGNEAYDFVSSDGAEDGPYTADGAAVTDDASLTVETTTEETPTPSPSPTPTPDEETPTPTEETPTPTDTEGQPGFGAALAIVALAGAALLALRRE